MEINTPTIPQYFNTPTSEQLRKAINTRRSQCQAILNYLIAHRSLTTLEAYQAGILGPAARIYELKQDGHLIHTTYDWSLNGLATYHLIRLATPPAKVVTHD